MVKQSGFSFVEILVTLLISTVGILGIGLLQLQAVKTSSDSSLRSNATWLAQDIAERMRVNTKGSRDNAYSGKVTCGDAPKICASHYASGRVAAQSCSAGEVAAYDMWDLACGLDSKQDQFRDSSDFMNGLTLELTCDDADGADGDACSSGSPVEIKLNWNERGKKPEEDGSIEPTEFKFLVRL